MCNRDDEKCKNMQCRRQCRVVYTMCKYGDDGLRSLHCSAATKDTGTGIHVAVQKKSWGDI